jgi:hypothetical protein
MIFHERKKILGMVLTTVIDVRVFQNKLLDSQIDNAKSLHLCLCRLRKKRWKIKIIKSQIRLKFDVSQRHPRKIMLNINRACA